ncbi:MAG: hypothetical protein AABX51_07265 [Nanoarchaeota archaeon]
MGDKERLKFIEYLIENPEKNIFTSLSLNYQKRNIPDQFRKKISLEEIKVMLNYMDVPVSVAPSKKKLIKYKINLQKNIKQREDNFKENIKIWLQYILLIVALATFFISTLFSMANLQIFSTSVNKQIEFYNTQINSISPKEPTINFRLLNREFLDEDLITIYSKDNKTISDRKLKVVTQIKNYGQFETGKVSITLKPENYPYGFYMDPITFDNIKYNQIVETTVNLSFAPCAPDRNCSKSEIYPGIHNLNFYIYCQFCEELNVEKEIQICVFGGQINTCF